MSQIATILRLEIFCIIILVFLNITEFISASRREIKGYSLLYIFALCYTIFDFITVISINKVGSIPWILVQESHIIFYIFGILYSIELFLFVLSNLPGRSSMSYSRRLLLHAGISIVFCLIFHTFAPIEYTEGSSSNYGSGLSANLSFITAFIAFALSLLVIIIKHKQLKKRTLYTLLPIMGVLLVMDAISIFNSHLLISGAAITLVTLGVYITLENKDYTEKMRKASERDSLTKIANRRYGERKIGTLIELQQYGTFCLIDFDKFKYINDTFGHIAGDEALVKVADVMKNCFRDGDVIMRLGGDEFAFFLKGVITPSAVLKTVQRFLDKVHNVKITNHPEYCIGVSIGVSFYVEDPCDFDLLYHQADQAMYTAKKNGADNKIVFFEEKKNNGQ